MGLVDVALIEIVLVCVCSNCKTANGDDIVVSGSEIPMMLAPLEREPVVMAVIMAGHDEPGYLAKLCDHCCSFATIRLPAFPLQPLSRVGCAHNDHWNDFITFFLRHLSFPAIDLTALNANFRA